MKESPTGIGDAVHPSGSGASLDLEVTAGVRKPEFPAGYNPWRKRIGIKVAAQAQKGQANADVVATVAGFFGVTPTSVTIESGSLDSRKTVLVRGVARADALKRLEAHLGA